MSTSIDLDRRRRITTAILILRSIDIDDIHSLDDAQLDTLRDALSGPWMMTESDSFRRRIAKIDRRWSSLVPDVDVLTDMTA